MTENTRDVRALESLAGAEGSRILCCNRAGSRGGGWGKGERSLSVSCGVGGMVGGKRERQSGIGKSQHHQSFL